MATIVANPAGFSLMLQDIPNEPYFDAVSTAKHTVRKGETLASVATLQASNGKL
jgi:hypothetical protein